MDDEDTCCYKSYVIQTRFKVKKFTYFQVEIGDFYFIKIRIFNDRVYLSL